MKSGIWQILWLDLISIIVYANFLVEDLRQFLYFHIFGLGVTLEIEKWSLTSPLARSSRKHAYIILSPLNPTFI